MSEQGHNESSTKEFDPWAGSSDDFKKTLAEGLPEIEDEETEEADHTDAAQGEDASEQTDTSGDSGQEKKPEGDSGQPEKPKEPEFEEIIWQGQVHRITKDKIKELAQKGFDYDQKVGPHQKLIQLIQADPEATKLLNEHFRRKAGLVKPEPQKFELEPIEKFNSADDWMRANIERMQQMVAAQSKPAPPDPMQMQHQGMQQVWNLLVSRDPDHAAKVIPVLEQEAENLTRKQYAEITSDLGAFLRFYDQVKTKVVAPPVAPKQKADTFRVKSGGGGHAQDSTEKNVWEMSNKDFQAAKIRLMGGGL